MIVLLTDFGLNDPYVGLLKATLAQEAPSTAVIDLLHSVPDYNAHAGAYLLAGLISGFPVGTVFLGVVDPGVGSVRKSVVLEADGRWYVGPDNGLFSVLAARASSSRIWQINWEPLGASATFHGRDVFAPIAAMIANNEFLDEKLIAVDNLEVQFDAGELPRIIYIDHYGNGWTGIRGGLVDHNSRLKVKDIEMPWHRVFSDADKGELFWYVNSAGLVEIAANRASAANVLGFKVGDVVKLVEQAGHLVH